MTCQKCNQEKIRLGVYTCKVCRETYLKNWLAKNREKKNANSRAWTAKNKEKSVQIKKQWEERNQTTLNEMFRINYAIRVKEGRQKKYKTDPAIRLAIKNRYRARKMNTVHIPYNSKELYAMSSHRCVYCGNEAKVLDHVIPLSRGGHDAQGNIVPACKSCNCSKGSKTISEWFEVRRQ